MSFFVFGASLLRFELGVLLVLSLDAARPGVHRVGGLAELDVRFVG